MREKLFIATFSHGAVAVIKEYGLNIEINHTCISEDLDEGRREGLLAAIGADLTASGVSAARSKAKARQAAQAGDARAGQAAQAGEDTCAENGTCAKAGAGRIIVHGPFTEIYPAAIDYRALEFGRRRLEEAFQVCQSIGAEGMVVHSGYVPFIYFKEWQAEKSALFWQDFMADKPADFRIFVENVLEDEPYMIANMMKQISDPRIRLCLDVGHAAAAGKGMIPIEEWIQVLGPYLGHFHLHNNYGDRDSHSAFGDGTMDFHRIFSAIETCCGDDVTFTIESRDCTGSVRWLVENGYLSQMKR